MNETAVMSKLISSQKESANPNLQTFLGDTKVEAEKAELLETRVQAFYQEHAVTASIPTVYTSLAVTLRRDV